MNDAEEANLQSVLSRHRWIAAPINAVDNLLTPSQFPRLLRAVRSGLVPRPRGAFSGELAEPLDRWRSSLLERRPALQGLVWRARQSVWSVAWGLATVSHMRPKPLPVPKREPHIGLISELDRHADFPCSQLMAPTTLPLSERSLSESLYARFIHFLQDVYPVISEHQPSASDDPEGRLRDVYPLLYRLIRPPPTWHPDLTAAAREGQLLAALATGGPFAKLLERHDGTEGDYRIDLASLADYPVRAGLARLGCVIYYQNNSGELSVSGIRREGQLVTPGGPGWELAERVASCTLLTHVGVWGHGVDMHLAGFAAVPVATYNLPPDNPIRRLLTPHIFLTLPANYNTHVTMRRNGFDVTGLSFPREVIYRYYDAGAEAFDLSRHDVRLELERRGIGGDVYYPYREQALRYYAIFETFARAYVYHHYPAEESLQADAEARLWDGMLEQRCRGYRKLVPTLTRETLVRFCTVFIYSVTVEHHENTLWNYSVFLPATVRLDGSAQTVGEVQSVMNFQMLTATQTNHLMADHTHVALDAEAARIMRRLQEDLQALQAEMETLPSAYWHVPPRWLEASVSA